MVRVDSLTPLPQWSLRDLPFLPRVYYRVIGGSQSTTFYWFSFDTISNTESCMQNVCVRPEFHATESCRKSVILNSFTLLVFKREIISVELFEKEQT